MKKNMFILITMTLFFVIPATVNASSITYNLNIEKDMNFKEDIVYKVKKSELDNSGDYDFLTSVVNSSIYFDNDSSVKYTKTKSYSNGEYTIHLKNNYSYLFLSNSRILHECFSDFDFDISNGDSISLRTSSPFYCKHRADNIKININTALKVYDNNADVVNGNTYTWNNINNDFEIRFEVAVAYSDNSSEQLDTITTNDVDGSDNDTNKNNDIYQDTNQDNKNTNQENNSFSFTTFIIILSIIIFLSLIIALVLKSKNNKVNKI